MNRKTVFMVDDDMTILALGYETLSRYYDIATFNSGILLLKMLEKCIPDMVLLDIEMPSINGFETIKRIKEKQETSHIPVIFLTSKNDIESELEGLSLGAIDYIYKPFTPPLLVKRIEVHLLVESQKQELISFNNNLLEMVDTKTKTVVELQNAFLKTMAELVDCRDDITGSHIERTQRYVGLLLNSIVEKGLYREETSTWDMSLILQSTQLHDVGKINIRDSILLKPGKLSNDEFEQIKLHTIFGEQIIDNIIENTTEHAFLHYAKIFAGSHHEKWDGSGYPRKLKGEEIPILGRAMAIADVYDALISERPYKKAFPHEEVIRIINESKGKHFDPVFVDLFMDVSDKFKEIATLDKQKLKKS
jgi:putative two-component system response regulator